MSATNFVAVSEQALEVLRVAQVLCSSHKPILIVGPRGSGKDRLAQFIHEAYCRQPSLFQKVDCNVGVQELTRTLYGYFDHYLAETAYYEEEAYRPGAVECAVDGMVYLDRLDLANRESTDLLLRVLANRSFKPVNGKKTIVPNNVRFVASCEPHPFEDRPDSYLHWRLQPIFQGRILALPSLRNRSKDIPDLLRSFTNELVPGMTFDPSEELLDMMASREWIFNLLDLYRFARFITTRYPIGGKIEAAVFRHYQESLPIAAPKEHARRARCSSLASGLRYQQTSVSSDQLYSWIEQFATFRVSTDLDPRDIAEYLLQRAVHRYYFSDERIREIMTGLYRSFQEDMEHDADWRISSTSSKYRNNKFEDFVVVSNPLGLMKSPGVMLPILRSVTRLTPRNSIEFDRISDFLKMRSRPAIILMVDDFVGTGKQFEDEVVNRIAGDLELTRAIRNHPDKPVWFVALVCVGHEDGVTRINKLTSSLPSELRIRLLVGEMIGAKDGAFHPESDVFSSSSARDQAKEIIVEKIGRRLMPKKPAGWGGELLVIFHHNTPNNTLPVFWSKGSVNDQPWYPIFPRLAAR